MFFGGNVVGLEVVSWWYFGKVFILFSWVEVVILVVFFNSLVLIYFGWNCNVLEVKWNRLLIGLFEF